MQDDLGPEPEAKHQDHRKRVNVEQRQDAEHSLLALFEGLRFGPCRLRILRGGCGQVGVGQHRAFGWAGGAAGVLDDRQRLRRIARSVSGIAPVIVEKISERDTALVEPDHRQHALRRHERLDRRGRQREFAEFADYERLQPRRVNQLLGLGESRGEVERDQNVGLAVLDFEFEGAQGVKR